MTSQRSSGRNPVATEDPRGIEREVMWTGIGGQGVQLAAKVLALAATREGREVMSLGTYGGTMRGGNTDATVVIANDRITSPPMVSRTWGAIVVHPRFFEPIRGRLRASGVLLVDADLLETPLFGDASGTTAAGGARRASASDARRESDPIGLPTELEGLEIVALEATRLARDADAPKAAALVLLGAFANATGIVSHEALEAALAESLPPYRRQSLESNRRALEVGRDAVEPLSRAAWSAEAA